MEEVLVTLKGHLQGRPVGHISGVLAEMIETGAITAGTRLPTVRGLAEALGVSPASVSNAWASLQSRGLITTYRRGGTIVTSLPARRTTTSAADVWTTMDLAYGMPDPSLQPNLAAALSAAANEVPAAANRGALSSALHRLVADDWPFAADDFVVVGGHNEGTILAIEAAAPKRSWAAVESPCSPRILNILDLLGIEPLPIPCDEDGPIAEALEQALRRDPAAFIIQPRAQIPLGHSISAGRLAELAAVLEKAGGQTIVVEDDHMGPLATHPYSSIGRYYKGPTLHVRGYCKAYGVELRTCVVGGEAGLIARMQTLRAHGVSRTSRILQDALAWLIADPQTQQTVTSARKRYEIRRIGLRNQLAARNIVATGDDGMLLTLPVPDEASTILGLAKAGIVVGPGSKCFVPSVEGFNFVRIATSLLPDEDAQVKQLADIIQNVVFGPMPAEID